MEEFVISAPLLAFGLCDCDCVIWCFAISTSASIFFPFLVLLCSKAHKSGMVYTGKLQREELVAWMAKKLDHGAPDEQQTEAPNSGKDKNEATDDGKDEL